MSEYPFCCRLIHKTLWLVYCYLCDIVISYFAGYSSGAVTNEMVRQKRNKLFSEEKARQLSLISRVEKIEVRHVGPPEDCVLLMNKGLSTPFNCAMREHYFYWSLMPNGSLCAVSVCQAVCQSVCHTGSFGAAFAKSLWPLVYANYLFVQCPYLVFGTVAFFITKL